MKQLALERIIVAGWSQAHSEQMFEVTREYVKERKVFGKKVADLQVSVSRRSLDSKQSCMHECVIYY